MGFEVSWDDDARTVLRYSVTGQWAWEEFYVARDQARQMVDAVEATHINSIIDLSSGSLFPQNALSHFRRMPAEAHPKLKGNSVVIVQHNLFVRSLMDIMRHLNRQAMANFHSAQTLEEARMILAKPQAAAAA